MDTTTHTRPTRARMQDLYTAAERLLEAREAGMLTADEWDAIEHACAACREPEPAERDEVFRVDDDGCLVRAVVPTRGDPYQHRCTTASFEAVASAASDLRPDPFVLEDLRVAAGLPWTQAAVAFAFLKERGVVIPADGRGHVTATEDAYLDAMTEYHALRENPAEG